MSSSDGGFVKYPMVSCLEGNQRSSTNQRMSSHGDVVDVVDEVDVVDVEDAEDAEKEEEEDGE